MLGKEQTPSHGLPLVHIDKIRSASLPIYGDLCRCCEGSAQMSCPASQPGTTLSDHCAVFGIHGPILNLDKELTSIDSIVIDLLAGTGDIPR